VRTAVPLDPARPTVVRSTVRTVFRRALDMT
jgi:hypothetical protein